MKGISFSNLNLVLDFVYNRRVSVPKHELDSFLSVARELEINGLTEKGEKNKKAKIEKLEIPEFAEKVTKIEKLEIPGLAEKARMDKEVFKEEATSSQKMFVTSTSEISNSTVKRKRKVKEVEPEKKEQKIKKKTIKVQEEIKEDLDDDIAIVEETSNDRKEELFNTAEDTSSKSKRIKKKFPKVMHVKTPGAPVNQIEQKSGNGKRKANPAKQPMSDSEESSDNHASPIKLDEKSEIDSESNNNADPVAKKLQKLEKYFAKEAEKDKETFELIIKNLSQNLDGKGDDKETVSTNHVDDKSIKSNSKVATKKQVNKKPTTDNKSGAEPGKNENGKSNKNLATDKSVTKKKATNILTVDEPKTSSSSKLKEDSKEKNDFWNISWPPEKGAMIAVRHEKTFCLGKVESKVGREGNVKVSFMKPYTQANSTDDESAGGEYWVWPATPDVRTTEKDLVLGTGPIIEFITKVGENLEDDLYNLTNFQKLSKSAQKSKPILNDLPLV